LNLLQDKIYITYKRRADNEGGPCDEYDLHYPDQSLLLVFTAANYVS